MKYKINSRQRHKSIQGLRSFKETLPTKARRIIIKKGEEYAKILDNWKYLVGDELFKVSYPKSFKKSNLKGKCLNISVQHGYEIDMEYSKRKIIGKINSFFGHNIIDGIFIKSFDKEINKERVNRNINVTKNKYEKMIYTVKNNLIKNSLLELNNLKKKREKN